MLSVPAVMKKLKVFIGLFEAINGIVQYFPDPNTGRLRRSQYLKIYSIIYCLLIACGIPLLFLELLPDDRNILIPLLSHWLRYGRLISIITHAMVALAIIYYAQFEQSAIQRIYLKLEVMEQFEPGAKDRKHLFTLLYMNLLCIISYLITHAFFDIWRLRHSNSSLQSLEIVYSFMTYCLAAANSLLIYEFLWTICYFGLGIQIQLKQLVAGRVQLQELQRLFKRQQDHIHLCSEFCRIFRHVMMFYLIKKLTIGILSGYFLIRLELTEGIPKWQLFTIFGNAIISFADFYILGNLARTVAAFIPNAIFVFRQSEYKSQRVERAMNLICLQLSCQNTDIHVFGVFTLNKRLWFIIMTEVLLNIIYMVQSDYHFFM